MASSLAKSGLSATPPTFAVKGAHNSLLLEMPGLGRNPPSGRLLRGLTPYLDEQGADHVFLLTERRRREDWNDGGDSVVSYQALVQWRAGAAGASAVPTAGPRAMSAVAVVAFRMVFSSLSWVARAGGSPCFFDSVGGRMFRGF